LSSTTPIYSANDARSDPSYWASAPNKPPVPYRKGNATSNTNDDNVAYTSPWTGATMTRKELREYGCGKQQAQEDGSVATVFFKPGFLASSEELWGRWLAPKQKLKAESG